MLIEIKVALNFLLSYLYDKLPRRRVNLFGDEIEKYLRQKLSITNNKSSDSFHLVIKINKHAKYIDPCLVQAAKESVMNLEEIIEQFPIYMKIFIMSGQVAYKQCNGSCNSDENNTNCKYCSGQANLIDEKEENIDLDKILDVNNVTFIYNSKSSSEQEQQASSVDNLNDASSKLNDFYQYLLNLNSLNNSQNQIKTISSAFNLSFQNQQLQQPLLSIGKVPIKHQQQQQKNSHQNLINPLSARNTSPSNTSEQWHSTPSSSLSCSSSSSSSSSTSSSSLSSSFSPAATQSLQMLKTFNDENTSLPVSPSSITNKIATPNSLFLNEFKQDNFDITSEGLNGKTENLNVAKLLKSPQNSLFTTASFAQTKFGSTKCKNYVKNKHQKMLPTEFSAYIKLKAQQKQTNGIDLVKTPTSPTTGDSNSFLHLPQKLSSLGQISSTPSNSNFNNHNQHYTVDQNKLNQFNYSYNQQLNLNDMILFEQQNNHTHFDKLSLSLPLGSLNNYDDSYSSLNNNSTYTTNQHMNDTFYQPFESIVSSTIKDLVDDEFGFGLSTNLKNNNFNDNVKTNNLISQLNKMSIDFAAAFSSNSTNSASS